MGFIKGQQLLYMGPVTAYMLVDFVEPDEGWCKIRFSDESEATVRPSHVRPLNTRTMEILLDRYAEVIGGGDHLQIGNMALVVERVADAIRYDDHGRLKALNTMAEAA